MGAVTKSPTVPLRVWILFAGMALLFTLFPCIDLWLSGVFYRPDTGFWIDGTWYERIVYLSVQYLLILTVAALVGAWIYGRLARRGRGPVSGRDLAFLLVLLLLGPGLVVNLGMKEHWGRARPVDALPFGGEKTFTPAFVPSDQGGKAFPSGHAAAVFYLVGVAFVVARRKRLWMRITLEYAALVCFFRIASGGHSVSDVLTSLFVVLILFLLLYRLFYGHPPALDEQSASGRGEAGLPE